MSDPFSMDAQILTPQGTPSNEGFFAPPAPPADADAIAPPASGFGYFEGGGAASEGKTFTAPVMVEVPGVVASEQMSSEAEAVHMTTSVVEGVPLPADEAFFSAYSAPAAEQLPAEPEMVDPRIAWSKKNQDALKKQADEEAKAKALVKAAAKAHTDKFYQAHNASLKKKAADNRAQQKVNPEAGVPTQGTTWEKVNALINFSAKGAVKDRDRFKAVLTTCKPRNITA